MSERAPTDSLMGSALVVSACLNPGKPAIRLRLRNGTDEYRV